MGRGEQWIEVDKEKERERQIERERERHLQICRERRTADRERLTHRNMEPRTQMQREIAVLKQKEESIRQKCKRESNEQDARKIRSRETLLLARSRHLKATRPVAL